MQHFEISVIVSMDVVKNLLVEKKKKCLATLFIYALKCACTLHVGKLHPVELAP